MTQFRAGSHVQEIVTLLSVVGEFPFQSLGILGSRRTYKAVIDKLTIPETFRNSQTGEKMTCKLFTLNGGGRAKTVRLYKAALPILEWVSQYTYQYYMDSFRNHNFSGDMFHLDRNHRVAEAVAVCMKAGIEFRPWMLPKLQNRERLPRATAEPLFYLSKDIKRLFDAGLNKTTFTRMVGAVISADNCYAVYNTRKAAMKWNGMGEFKAQGSLTDLARLNFGIDEVNSAILFGASEEIALQSFSEKSKGQKKELRADEVYQHIHFIPLNEFGARQLRILLAPNWKERLLDLLFDPDTRSYDQGRFEYDADIDGTNVFSYLDGNLTRLMRFKHGIENNQEQCEVLCFPHQVNFIREYLKERVGIKTIGLDVIESTLDIEAKSMYY